MEIHANFCKGYLNRFIWFLRTAVYPHEGLDTCDKLDKTSLSDLEDINKPDYEHAKNVRSVQNDNLFLGDNFRKKISKTHYLDPEFFYSVPGLVCIAEFKWLKLN